MSEKNIVVRKGAKTRRARKEELPWFKQRGWLPDSPSEVGRAVPGEPSAPRSEPSSNKKGK